LKALRPKPAGSGAGAAKKPAEAKNKRAAKG
jgi:hypothetical protein